MPLLLYSESVTRADMPWGKAPTELTHPFYPFDRHYELYMSHCQKFDSVYGSTSFAAPTLGATPSAKRGSFEDLSTPPSKAARK